MDVNTLAPAETMQVHEMLNFKTVCMLTSKLMEGVVFDQELKALLNAKNGVRNCAIALTEASSPMVRSVLITQLNRAIDLHTEITDMMIEKRWIHPLNLEKQFQMDAESSNMAVKIGKMDLFPGDTSRLGTFATPEK